MNQSILTEITSRNAGRESIVRIMLDQDGYLPCTGEVTKAAMVRFLADLIYQSGESAGVQCGMDGDVAALLVSAYLFDPGLNYRLLATYGLLSEGARHEREITETLQFKLTDEVSVKYPVAAISSVNWLSPFVRDKDFNKLEPKPDLAPGDELKTIKSSVACYGSAKVVYTTVVDSYILNIPPREDVEENKYSSVVYAVYSGRPVWLVTDPPPGAEEMEGDCAGQDTGHLGRPPKWPSDLPKAYANRAIRINYCTTEKLSDVIHGV